MSCRSNYTLRIVFNDEVAPKVVLKDTSFEEVIKYLNDNYREFENAGIYISKGDS